MTRRTLADVMVEIEEQRRRFVDHPFLAGLDASSDVDRVRVLATQLYFYVFAFQDMLRLSHESIEDPDVRAIASRHRDEDAGHERWFASDVVELDCVRDVQAVFGAELRASRDLSYAIIAEILHAGDDRLRLTVPLVLEAVGSTFFHRVSALLERAGFDRPLRYFARSHEQVESSHDMFTEAGAQEIRALELDDAVYERAVALVRRCFGYFDRCAAAFEAQRVAAPPPGASAGAP